MDPLHQKICNPYHTSNDHLIISINALGISLPTMYHLLSFLSRNISFWVKSFTLVISLVTLLFCNTSNFDIITLIMFLSICITISLLSFLRTFIRWLPTRAIVIIRMNTHITTANTPHHNLVIMSPKVMMVVAMIVIPFPKNCSNRIVCQLPHHLDIMLFACPVPSISTLLLSALRYFST